MSIFSKWKRKKRLRRIAKYFLREVYLNPHEQNFECIEKEMYSLDNLVEYLNQSLSKAKTEELEKHLRRCYSCQSEIVYLHKTYYSSQKSVFALIKEGVENILIWLIPGQAPRWVLVPALMIIITIGYYILSNRMDPELSKLMSNNILNEQFAEATKSINDRVTRESGGNQIEISLIYPIGKTIFDNRQFIWNDTLSSEGYIILIKSVSNDIVYEGTTRSKLLRLADSVSIAKEQFYSWQISTIDGNHFSRERIFTIVSNDKEQKIHKQFKEIDSSTKNEFERDILKSNYLIEEELFCDATKNFTDALKYNKYQDYIHKNLAVLYEKLELVSLALKEIQIINSSKSNN